MGQRYPVIVGLCDSRGSWLRHVVSGSYYISHPNQRIFWKIATRIVVGINNPGPPLGHVIRDVWIRLRQWSVRLWKARVVDQCDFPSLWFRYAVSGSYHGSRPNRRIFWKFAIHVVGGVNIPSLFHGHVIRRRSMTLRRTGVLWRVGIVDLCDFPRL